MFKTEMYCYKNNSALSAQNLTDFKKYFIGSLNS